MNNYVRPFLLIAGVFVFGWAAFFSLTMVRGDEPPATEPGKKLPAAEEKPGENSGEKSADKNIVYFDSEHDVWLDKKAKAVVMKGKIAVREGNLEMFACPVGTKEHESIVAVTTKALPVHAALLAAGAKSGHPASFADNKFTPASGTEIEVLVRWTDDKGAKQEAKGQDWIRNLKTKKPLEYPWVFGGSVMRTDPDTGEKYYYADGGDFICVANFPTAMLDLPIESPKAWDDHIFEPFTEHIPPRGTEVELVLIPKPDKAAAKEGEKTPDKGTPATK